jgi:SET domain-containing protein
MDPITLFDQASLAIQDCGLKGRGIVTRRPIPSRTIIDISPILLFPTEEYNQHGQFTQLDHYTYRWQGGMALALGLGSMFNHSNKPNVGFQRDFPNKVIRYSTLREIEEGEELCISYGPNLWFPDMEDEEESVREDKRDTDSGYNGSSGNQQEGSGSPMSEDSDDETAESFLGRFSLSHSDDEGKE